MANKNQKQIRNILGKVKGRIEVPCSGPNGSYKREIPYGFQTRLSHKPKVVWNANKKSKFSDN